MRNNLVGCCIENSKYELSFEVKEAIIALTVIMF